MPDVWKDDPAAHAAIVPGESPAPIVPDPLTGPDTMQKRLWVIYPLTGLAITAVYGAVLQLLLARQIAGFTTDAAAPAVLGAIVSVGAIVSLFAQPIVGRLSDRTRTRILGRRNLWALGCAVISIVGLLILPFISGAVPLAIAWGIVIVPLNGYQVVTTAVLPERVPARNRGTMSGVAGAAALVGTFAGIAIGGLVQNLFVCYGILAGFLLVMALVFALGTKDFAPPAIDSTVKVRSGLPGIKEHANFYWAILGRFVAFLGYTLATALQVYVMKDYVGIGDLEAAGVAVVQVSGISTLMILISSLLGGILADRVGRLKPFVIASSLIFVPGCVIALVAPSFTGLLIAYAVLGFGFGAYLSVDQALISRVLPTASDAGRDLGIANVANAGPQVFAPVVAGALVAAIGFPPIWILGIVFAIAASAAVLPIRGIR